MTRVFAYAVLCLTLLGIIEDGGAAALGLAGIDRSLMVSTNATLKTPVAYVPRQLPPDPVTGEIKTYDHKPTVTTVDDKAGLFDLCWIGYDQRPKTIRFQMPDRIALVVAANVRREAGGATEYRYTVTSHETSGQRLAIFVVQSLSPTAVGERRPELLVTPMAPDLEEFEGGKWWAFYLLPSSAHQVHPGMSMEFVIRANSAPGLVGCRAAGGTFGMKGPDEEIPFELEDILPGYKVWPKSRTLGPDETVARMSSQERRMYWLERLPQLEELGWMSSTSRTWYQERLVSMPKAKLAAETIELHRRSQVTSEVLAIVDSL